MKQILKAKRELTGTAPKRKVATRQETLDVRAKEAKHQSKEADDSNGSTTSRTPRP